MLLKSTIAVGLALAGLCAFGPAAQAAPKPAAKPKAAAKAKPKPAAPRPAAVGRTPTETVSLLIKAMQKKNRDGISGAFDWHRFAAEMNKLIPGEKGLDASTYKTLLVETLDVETNVSNNLRVGPETRKGANLATVEMRRVFPSGSGASATAQVRTINVLSLAKGKDGWKIYRLDSVQQAVAPPAAPPVPRAPQGMVPAAGANNTKP